MYGYNDDSTGLEPEVEQVYAICKYGGYNPKILLNTISTHKSKCWDNLVYDGVGSRDAAIKRLRRDGYRLITVKVEKQ